MQFRPLAAALLCAAPLVSAQESTEPVVVTASRVTETADASLAPVTVITRADIERSQAPTMVELLRLHSGIDVVRTGGPGTNTNVFVRGTNSSHVLVLVDGMRVSSATTGEFAWQSLDPAQIERIEIVRGPRSTLYGSDALGGVIQIFTRRPEGATLRASAGSYGTYGLDAGYGGGEQFRYHLLASGLDSEGFDAKNRDVPGHDPDRDGFRNRSVSAALGTTFGGADATLNLWRSEGRTEYDEGVQKTINQALDARLSGEVTAGWIQSLRAGTGEDDSEYRSTYPGRFITTRRGADWQHTLSFAERHMLVAGIDWTEYRGENRDITNSGSGYDHRIADHGLYLNYTLPAGPAELQTGLRRDRNDIFGDKTTGQVALGYDASAQLRVFATYGTAFKAPTLNDLYYPMFGNPDLKPESSESSELGLRYRADSRQHLALNLFQTDVTDLIVADIATYVPSNVAKARIRGAELEYAVAPGAWDFSAHLTLQEARDLATDKPLLRRPDRKLALVGARTLENASVLRGELLLVGERRDEYWSNTEFRTKDTMLPGYGLVNVAAIQPIGRHWRVEGRVDNLFDQDYTEAFGFNTAGRVFNLALAYGH